MLLIHCFLRADCLSDGEVSGTDCFAILRFSVYFLPLNLDPALVISLFGCLNSWVLEFEFRFHGLLKLELCFTGFSVFSGLAFSAGMRGHAEFCRLGSDKFSVMYI